MRGQNPLTDFIEVVIRRIMVSDGTVLDVSSVADNEFLKRSGTSIIGAVPSGSTRTLTFEFDGGGNSLSTSIDHAVIISCPFNCTISEIYIKDVTDTTGTCTIDLWKDLRSNATPDVGDSITGSGVKPFISGPSAESTPQTSFTGWSTTTINSGDEIHAVLTAVSGHKHLVMTIKAIEF